MATRTNSTPAYFNGYRLGSWALHAASWLTTYWLCEWIGTPAVKHAFP